MEFKFHLTLKAKEIAKENKFESSLKLVQTMFKDPANCLFIDNPSTAPLSMRSIVRIVDITREKLRPSNPDNLFFEIERDHVPDDFFRGDVVAVHSEKHRERHLIFGTEEQTKLLKSAKCWFLDRTSRLIDKPFVEIISIHGAYPIPSKKDLKQVQLLYVFMSSRKVKDYSIVFEKILEMLGHDHCVKQIVFNFSKSVLQALEQNFPTVSLYGCPFQWAQTVLKKFKSLGLIPLYERYESVQKLCSQVLALHLLPGKDIPKAFYSLKAKAGELKLSEQNSERLMQFFGYVEETWITNSVWTPERWSVFMQPVMRTDVDAWHRQLKSIPKLRVNLETEDFYTLVFLLYKRLNATWPKEELQLVSQKQQTKILRKRSMTHLAYCLYKHWDSYNDGDLTELHLLKLCSDVFLERYDLNFVDCAS